MSNVKYEAVFGPQELFEDAKDNVVAIGYIPGDFKSKICCTKEQLEGLEQSDYIHYPIIAMRRIIKVPTWTVADQQAGRLPEVGCRCRTGKNEEIVRAVTKVFIVTEDDDGSVSTTRIDHFLRTYQPIESPEEKAWRLEEEFIYQFKPLPSCKSSESFVDGLRAAYRKLQK